MEKLGTNKLNMQKLLAPAALVILYIVFSIFGNNFLSLDMVKNILESITRGYVITKEFPIMRHFTVELEKAK